MTEPNYKLLNSQVRALLDGEKDVLAASSNFCALLYNAIDDINWLGIYVLRGAELVLGPFQGKPACVRISLGKGVCGDAAKSRQTIRVNDVHAYPGHIACDADSRSEIVLPMLRDDQLLGVLDIDSPLQARFDADDQQGIEMLVATFLELLPSSRAADGFI